MVRIGTRSLVDLLAFPNLPRRSVIGDAVIGLVLTMMIVAIATSEGQAVAVVASVMIGVALMIRRVAPSLMMALALVSAVLQVATYEIAVPASLLYSILYYTAGNHPHGRVRAASLAVGVVGSAVAAWVYPRAPGLGGVDEVSVMALIIGFIGIAVLLVGSWTFGYIRYQRQSVERARVAEQIAQLERRRLLDLYDEQAQRSALARDMHDVVAHSLAVVVAQAEGARFVLETSPDAAKDALGVIADTARQALADVRGVLEELRSTESTADHARTDRGQLYERMRAAGMMLQSTEIGDEDAASPLSVRVAFAVLTEALTNALKYGDLERSVDVRQEWTDGCRLTVRNALSEKPLAPGGAGHGIRGMIERAELAGGTLTSAAMEDGWLVELVIPERPEGLQ